MLKNIVVSVILVNFNGRNFLEQCLVSLGKQDYPKKKFEIILVDNNSWDNSVEFVRERFPDVRIISNKLNAGFAGGNNIGAKAANGKYIALLNNDTVTQPHWLSKLVQRIELTEAKNIAAVSGKSLLYYPFLNVRVVSDVFMRSEFTNSANFQQVGVLLEQVILSDKHLQTLMHQRSGFYKAEPSFPQANWTNGNGQLLIPVDPTSDLTSFVLTIRAQKTNSSITTKVSILIDDEVIVTNELSSYQVKQYVIQLSRSQRQSHLKYAVQNAGNVVFKDGFVRDLGSAVKRNEHSYELDSAYWRQSQDITAFCGTNVLIRKDIFLQLGGFDETFFMYYEDADLSLRFLRHGYRIVFEPGAVIHHIHSGSSGSTSSFVLYYAERNHLLFLMKQFPSKIVLVGTIRQIFSLLYSHFRVFWYSLRGNLTKAEFWQDKVAYRTRVLGWFVRNSSGLFAPRFELQRKEKLSLMDVFSRLY